MPFRSGPEAATIVFMRSESGTAKVTIAVTALLFIATLFVGLGFFFRTALQPYQPQNTTRVTIEINRGKGPPSISRQLEAMRIIRSAEIFLYYGKLEKRWAKIKAGEYELSPSMRGQRVRRRGGRGAFRLPSPPGWWRGGRPPHMFPAPSPAVWAPSTAAWGRSCHCPGS